MLSLIGNATTIAAANVAAADCKAIPRRTFYESSPPHSANMEMLKGRWRSSQEEILARQKASLPPAFVVRLSKATVFGNGAVMLESGVLVADTLPSNVDLDVPRQPIKGRHAGPVALLRKPGDSNFGHWIVELLPRVFEFRAAFPDLHLKFAVPANPYSMQPLRAETLKWLGVEEADIIWLSPDPNFFDDLLIITSNSIHSHTHDADGLNRLAELARAVVPQSTKRRRIYAKRPGGIKRQLIGEEKVIEIAEANNFEIVCPEQMTIVEQVTAFGQAEMIVGVSGAALTNVLWAAPPCRVLSFNPDVGHEFFFWDIANIRGLEFSFLFGEVVGKDNLGHSDFTIEPDRFREWLRG